MVATTEGQETEEIAARADSPFESGYAVVASAGPCTSWPKRGAAAAFDRPSSSGRWPYGPVSIGGSYRCQGDAACLARAIARHRTMLSVEHVIRILAGADE